DQVAVFVSHRVMWRFRIEEAGGVSARAVIEIVGRWVLPARNRLSIGQSQRTKRKHVFLQFFEHCSGGDTSSFFNPESPHYSVTDENGHLIGFLATGVECQVPGGDYSAPAVDIGIGLHPDVTGRGLGRTILKQFIHEIIVPSDHPPLLRATIAAFNQRSRRTFLALGFEETSRFETMVNDRLIEWIIVVRSPGS
ncbi:MAG: GNAT family N-acetyltransferase, partial [Thermomicrobiales bacterium]